MISGHHIGETDDAIGVKTHASPPLRLTTDVPIHEGLGNALRPTKTAAPPLVRPKKVISIV